MAQAPKFYTDVHIPKAVVKQLRDKGVDIIHGSEVGKSDDSDVQHLTYCADKKRTIISFDSDFEVLHYRWLTEGKWHAGILKINVALQGDNGIGRIVAIVLGYHENITGGAGQVETDLHNRLYYER